MAYKDNDLSWSFLKDKVIPNDILETFLISTFAIDFWVFRSTYSTEVIIYNWRNFSIKIFLNKLLLGIFCIGSIL